MKAKLSEGKKCFHEENVFLHILLAAVEVNKSLNWREMTERILFLSLCLLSSFFTSYSPPRLVRLWFMPSFTHILHSLHFPSFILLFWRRCNHLINEWEKQTPTRNALFFSWTFPWSAKRFCLYYRSNGCVKLLCFVCLLRGNFQC